MLTLFSDPVSSFTPLCSGTAPGSFLKEVCKRDSFLVFCMSEKKLKKKFSYLMDFLFDGQMAFV